MTALAIIAVPFVLAAFAALARATREQRREIDRRRLEAMDERRAAARLYAPERHRLEVKATRHVSANRRHG
jgi:hypothetical protein